MKYLLTPILLFAFAFTSHAQPTFPNTLRYNDSIGSPKADLSAINWLAGHWQGEAFGGIVEEIWAPPIGNSMMGAFKLVVNNAVQFYEIETIGEEKETLILRLKHFNANLTGWELKDQTVDFKLVKVTDTKVFFDGFTLEYISDKELNMYVVIDHNGKAEEIKFNYKRVADSF